MSVRSLMHGKLSVIVHCYPGVKLEFIVWKGLQVTSNLAAYTSFSAALLLINFISCSIYVGVNFVKCTVKYFSVLNHESCHLIFDAQIKLIEQENKRYEATTLN